MNAGKEKDILRSMMQLYAKGSVKVPEFYQEVFGAEFLCAYPDVPVPVDAVWEPSVFLCAYPDVPGGYMHLVLNIFGQTLAVSEIEEKARDGNTMQFRFL